MRNGQNQIYPPHEWVPPSQSSAAQIRFHQVNAKQEKIKISFKREKGPPGVQERRPGGQNQSEYMKDARKVRLTCICECNRRKRSKSNKKRQSRRRIESIHNSHNITSKLQPATATTTTTWRIIGSPIPRCPIAGPCPPLTNKGSTKTSGNGGRTKGAHGSKERYNNQAGAGIQNVKEISEEKKLRKQYSGQQRVLAKVKGWSYDQWSAVSA